MTVNRSVINKKNTYTLTKLYLLKFADKKYGGTSVSTYSNMNYS